VTKRT